MDEDELGGKSTDLAILDALMRPLLRGFGPPPPLPDRAAGVRDQSVEEPGDVPETDPADVPETTRPRPKSESEPVEREEENANRIFFQQLATLTSEILYFTNGSDRLFICFFGMEIDVEESCRRIEKSDGGRRCIPIPGINGLLVDYSRKSQQQLAGLFRDRRPADGTNRVRFSSKLHDQMVKKMANCLGIRMFYNGTGRDAAEALIGIEHLGEKRARLRYFALTNPEELRNEGPILRNLNKEKLDDAARGIAERVEGKVLATSAKGEFLYMEIEGDLRYALGSIIER